MTAVDADRVLDYLELDRANALRGRYAIDPTRTARAIVAARLRLWPSIVVGVVVGVALVAILGADRPDTDGVEIVVGAVLGVGLALAFRWTVVLCARRNWAYARREGGPLSLTLNLGALRRSSAVGTVTTPWSAYSCFTVRQGYVLLLAYDGSIEALPSNAFDGDALELLAARRLRRHDGRAFRRQLVLDRRARPTGSWNAFALVAPAAAVVVPPRGLILGILALRAINRRGEHGRFNAVFAIVAGSMLTCAVAINLAIFFALRVSAAG